MRGVKGHAEIGGFTRWGDEAMRRAAEIGRALDLPLYIHFGQLWPLPDGKHPYDPDAVLPDMLEILRPGDILAHPFTRHPGGFVDRHGKLHPVVREALARGLKVDVGHGSHFSFKMARLALDAGVVPDTLGADMHGYNTTIPKPRGTPESASRQGRDAHVRRPPEFLAGLGDDQHAGARPHDRAGRADGHQQLRRDARHGGRRSGR